VQLQQQQRELEIAIKDQENQQAELNAAQAQQSEMLAYTAGQKAAYDQQIKSTNSQIASLKAQQAAANARLFAGSGGVTNRSQCGPNYPAYLCNRSMDTLVDAWGMYNRECVSYVAYMVDNDGIGGGMPYWGGRGHAWMWGFSGYMGYDKQHVYSNTGAWHTANALSDGIAYVSAGELQRGDVAVKDGPYGHVMYIESVNPNGTINISQFNHDLTGTYSEAFNVSTGGLVFLRF
jgi:surface antigen